jgi:hypothetical protein
VYLKLDTQIFCDLGAGRPAGRDDRPSQLARQDGMSCPRWSEGRSPPTLAAGCTDEGQNLGIEVVPSLLPCGVSRWYVLPDKRFQRFIFHS